LQKKCEYIIKEVNQPSERTMRQFHKEMYQTILRITETEEKLDIPMLKTSNSTHFPCET
jgi:hypothetical protein